ncbi:MAG: hypothetical protein HOP07_04460 [Bacteriovoracaceae bacterium]|nr:hypothetical protein [Bacteriovoracaceae bacterium]
MKFFKLLIFIFIFTSFKGFAFNFNYREIPLGGFDPFVVKHKECESFNFLIENELNTAIPNSLCNQNETPEECLDAVLDDPQRQRKVIIYFGIDNFQASTNFLKKTIINKDNPKAISLYCISHLLSPFLLDSEVSELNKNNLFLLFLPTLFEYFPPRLQKKLFITYEPFIFSMLKKTDFFEQQSLIQNGTFKAFIYANFLEISLYKQIPDIEKTLLSLNILENLTTSQIPISSELREEIINYLVNRPRELIFTTEILDLLKTDPSYLRLILKSIEQDSLFYRYDINSKGVKIFLDRDTNINIKCEIAKKLINHILIPPITPEHQKNKLITLLNSSKLDCIKKYKNELDSMITTSAKFTLKWCPHTPECLLHFNNDNWKYKFAFCKANSDCKSIRHDKCPRLYFNSDISTDELKLYNSYCLKGSISKFDTVDNLKFVCQDNICQEKGI